jgi:hypothetical protein
MKCSQWLIAGFLALALSTANLWGQGEAVKVRVRAIAGPDGKVEVVEETVEGDPKEGSEAKRYLTIKAAEEEKKADVRATAVRSYRSALSGAAKEEKSDTAEWGELPQSDYWIGVQIAPVPPEVRKHMAVKHGILILHVYADSPAAKAELQVDDILIQAGDTKVETGPDLIKAVDAAKTNELTFKVLREGQERTVKVTPVKRSEAVTATPVQSLRVDSLKAAERELERALAALKAQNAENAAVDFMLVRPGAYVYDHPEARVNLPEDVSIQITKQGNKPASIRVVQGEKTYEAAEGKLDSIPKELRSHVERMLAGGAGALAVRSYSPQRYEMNLVAPPVAGGRVAPRVPAPVPVPPLPGVPGNPPTAPPVPPSPANPARVAWLPSTASGASDAKLDQILKKLDSLARPDFDEIKKELQSLRKEVDELRKKSSGSESSR